MFVPLSRPFSDAAYFVIVAHPLECDPSRPDVSTLEIFKSVLSDGIQGFNYKPGIWHHPMVVTGSEIDFLAIVWERGIESEDTIEYYLEEHERLYHVE